MSRFRLGRCRPLWPGFAPGGLAAILSGAPGTPFAHPGPCLRGPCARIFFTGLRGNCQIRIEEKEYKGDGEDQPVVFLDPQDCENPSAQKEPVECLGKLMRLAHGIFEEPITWNSRRWVPIAVKSREITTTNRLSHRVTWTSMSTINRQRRSIKTLYEKTTGGFYPI